MDYSTVALIAAVKRRGSIPTSQNLFLPQGFVDVLNDELQSTVVPVIMKVREEYMVASKDMPVSPGVDRFTIPQNAVGGKLRDVVMVLPNGETYSLPRLAPEDVSNNAYTFGRPTGFYLENNNVVLYPKPNNFGTLRLSYYRRPNNLVQVSAAGQVRSVNTATNEITLVSSPPSWTANVTLVDVISNKPGFDALQEEVIIQAKSGSVITLASVVGISAGDWICLTGESPVPQVPVEAHQLLAQAAVVKCLEALGDSAGMEKAEKKYNDMERNFLTMISPRVDGEPKKVVNSTGIFAFSRGVGRFFR